MNNQLLACKELYKTFSTGADDVEVEVIRGVNLEVQAGDFTVLMGSSGSGKSTLLYLMSGLESITTGEAWFDNQMISSMKEKDLSLLRRTGMGFVFQAFNMIPNLTVMENILVAGYLGNPNKKAVEDKAKVLLDNFGLAHLADRLPARISGGEQQRASTARALINSPRILFADEPTGALNSAAGKKVLDYFTRLAADGQTIFMVTHDLKGACRGNRVLYMNDGQISGEYKFDDDKLSFSRREEVLFAWLTKQGW